MDRDGAQTGFLTAISHDMRQPLHALMLYLGALERRVHEPEAREVLGKASDAAQSLAKMIEGVVQLARIETGKVDVELEGVRLQSLFENLVAHAPAATLDPTALYVRSDSALLETIMRELISNAIEHGGGNVHIRAEAKDGDVDISVTDSGPGIAATDQSKIFEQFERLGVNSGGLGIGLSIAKRLADLLRHDLAVRSTPGEGATFVLRAPRA